MCFLKQPLGVPASSPETITPSVYAFKAENSLRIKNNQERQPFIMLSISSSVSVLSHNQSFLSPFNQLH